MDNKVRLGIYLVPELKEYLEKTSEAYGMSVSSFMALIITTYRQQTQAMVQLADIKNMIDDIKVLQDKEESKRS